MDRPWLGSVVLRPTPRVEADNVEELTTRFVDRCRAGRAGADEAATMQKAVAAPRADPQMRTAFLNMVAPTIANKMFECGMIP